MKAKINTGSTGFKKFTLNLEIESVDEARLLFHVFNYTDLVEHINDEMFYDMDDYTRINRDNVGVSIYDMIMSEIESQGYKI